MAGREAEEQQRMAALAAKAEEERKQQEVAAAAAAEESERQRLRSLSQRFVLRLEGSISITRPPKVSFTAEKTANVISNSLMCRLGRFTQADVCCSAAT
jgi:hypothetical protein